jgi:hypothetical protein
VQTTADAADRYDAAAGRHDADGGAARRGRAAGRRSAAGGRRAAAGRRRAAAEQLGGRERERTGVQRREGAADAAERRAVLTAPAAVAQVLARVGGGLDATVAAGGEVGPDVVAVGVAGLGRLHEPDASADEQRFDGRDGDVERDGEVGVGHAVHLPHEQRRALLLRKPADVLDQAREVLAPLRLLDGVAQRLARELEDVGRRQDRAAQVVDAAVVGDPVEPGTDVDVARVGPQGSVRAHEHVLQEVLGVLPRAAPQHLAHVGEQALAVAVVDDAERLVAPGAEERQQLIVRAQAQQRHPDRPAALPGRCTHCRGFHPLRSVPSTAGPGDSNAPGGRSCRVN